SDGSRSQVYRETVRLHAATSDPALLVAAFELPLVGTRGFFHTLFRPVSMVNTPLFAGFPGFRSKLWLTDLRTGVYRGAYQWDGPRRADDYAVTLTALLRPLCHRGSVAYHVHPGVWRDDFLREPAMIGVPTRPEDWAGRGHRPGGRGRIDRAGHGGTDPRARWRGPDHRAPAGAPAVPRVHRPSPHAGSAGAGGSGGRPDRPRRPEHHRHRPRPRPQRGRAARRSRGERHPVPVSARDPAGSRGGSAGGPPAADGGDAAAAGGAGRVDTTRRPGGVPPARPWWRAGGGGRLRGRLRRWRQHRPQIGGDRVPGAGVPAHAADGEPGRRRPAGAGRGQRLRRGGRTDVHVPVTGTGAVAPAHRGVRTAGGRGRTGHTAVTLYSPSGGRPVHRWSGTAARSGLVHHR